jgi:hypothetical protein
MSSDDPRARQNIFQHYRFQVASNVNGAHQPNAGGSGLMCVLGLLICRLFIPGPFSTLLTTSSLESIYGELERTPLSPGRAVLHIVPHHYWNPCGELRADLSAGARCLAEVVLAGPELCHHDLAVQQTDAASCAVVVGTAEEEAEEATACELKGDASGCTKRAGKGSCDFTAAVTVGWTSVRSSAKHLAAALSGIIRHQFQIDLHLPARTL